MSEPVVRYRVDEHIAYLELHRPESLNAVNGALSDQVGQALQEADRDESVRVVILHGAGRIFCAGADLKALSRGESVFPSTHPEWGFGGITRHWIDKPVIAAVHGAALGGGLEIMLACDLAIAEEGTTFGLPEVTRGLLAGGGGVVRLPRFISRVKALEMGLTGAPIPADEALDLGLVNEIVSQGTALERAGELARLIAQNAPLAVQATKRVMHSTFNAGPDWDVEGGAATGWLPSDVETERLMASEDALEGPRAFAEKRAPRWSGR